MRAIIRLDQEIIEVTKVPGPIFGRTASEYRTWHFQLSFRSGASDFRTWDFLEIEREFGHVSATFASLVGNSDFFSIGR